MTKATLRKMNLLQKSAERRVNIVCGTLVIIIGLLIYWVFMVFQSIYTAKEQRINTDALKYKQIIPWGVTRINAPALWPEITGKGIKIAVMDSGINFMHPDLGKNIKEGYNAINPNELPIDDFGHGTLVAGVIAAQNNQYGIVGVSPDVELYPIKVLDKYGEGEISDIAKGIEWCINNKIQIINMSFAISKDNPLLRSSVMKAIDVGIIVVASASNTYGGEVGYPASYKKVISVTAVDSHYMIGNATPRGKIDFSSSGVNVVSTSINGGYEEVSGTSMAAPYISGLIALILQNPHRFGIYKKEAFSPSYIYKFLKSMSKHLGDKSVYGEGFVFICTK